MQYDNAKLKELQQQVARKKRLTRLLEELKDRRYEVDKKVAELEKSKISEQKDVDRLEGISLASFFYGLVGKKDEKLDKERTESYAATAKYETAMCELEVIDKDIDRYEAELRSLTWCEKHYEEALNEKKEAIKQSGVSGVEELLELEHQLDRLENQIKEIDEAIAAGNKADSIADHAYAKVSDAEGWGTWDMLGGGTISSLAKHSCLNEAQQYITQLQISLSNFKTELTDVRIQSNMSIQIDGFLQFADFVFDGLFVDWAVQDKIVNSKKEIEKTKNQIGEVLEKLSHMKEAARKEWEQKKEELDNKVLNV